MIEEKIINQKPPPDTDRPKEAISEDELDRADFAKNIAETIINYSKSDNQEPLIIGLYGPWGYGKTTVLNFIKKHIKKYKNEVNNTDRQYFPDVVHFDTWIFANQEELISRFLKWLIKELKGIDPEDRYKGAIKKAELLLNFIESVDPNNLGNIIKNIAIVLTLAGGSLYVANLADIKILTSELIATLSPILILVGAISSIARKWLARKIKNMEKELSENLTLAKLRESLRNELNGLDNKLVICIDELDRLNEEEIKCVFQLVKATFNMHNLIFILAFDKEKVGKLISIKSNDDYLLDGRDYIDKIVQLPISIPMPDKRKMGEFFDKHVNRSIKFIAQEKWDNNWWQDIYNSGLGSILLRDGNPRRIIRNFNSIIENLYPIKNEVNAVDFIAIMTIQMFYPEIYEYISCYKNLFIELEGRDIVTLSDLIFEGEKAKEEINKLLDNVDDNAQNVIRKLFPKMENYLPDGRTISFYPKTKYDWTVNRRICSSDYFDFYFALKIPEGEKSINEVYSFINYDGSVDGFENMLSKHLKDGYLPRFLDILNKHSETIPLGNSFHLIISILNISEEFPDEYMNYSINPYEYVTEIATTLIRRRGKNMGPDTLINVIRESNSIYIPLKIIDGLENAKSENRLSQTVFNEKQLEFLKSIIIQKIENLFDENNLINKKRIGFIIDRWHLWSENKNRLETFIDQIVNDIDSLIKLLPHYVRSQYVSSSSNYHEYRFDYETLAKLGTNMERIYTKIHNIIYDKSTEISKEQLRAVKLYEIDYSYFRQNKRNRDEWHREEQI